EDEQRDEQRREPVPPPHERADELAPLMPQQRKVDHEAASLLGASIRPGRRRPYPFGLAVALRAGLIAALRACLIAAIRACLIAALRAGLIAAVRAPHRRDSRRPECRMGPIGLTAAASDAR